MPDDLDLGRRQNAALVSLSVINEPSVREFTDIVHQYVGLAW